MLKKVFNFSLNLGISSTAKSLYWVFSGNAVSIGLTFFTTLIIARVLNKADNGIFLALFTYANLLSELGEAGLGSTLSNFIPSLLKKKDFLTAKKYSQTAFGLEIFIAIILTLGTLVLANDFSQVLFARTEINNIYLTAAMSLFMLVFSFTLLVLVAYKKYQKVALLNIFYSLIRLVILIILLKYVQLTLTNILWVYLLAGLATFILGIILIRNILEAYIFETSLVKQILGFSGFLAFQKGLIAISSRLDLLMLVPLAGAVNAGIYGVASRFALVYPVLVSSLGQVLGPKFSELESRQALNIFFRKLIVLVCLLLISSIAFFYLSKTVIIWFLPSYTEAIPVLKGILLAYTSFILATPFTSFLIFYMKKPQITVLTSSMQLIIILLSNFYFLPRLGAFGPVAGIALGNLAVLIFTVSATWYYLNSTNESRN